MVWAHPCLSDAQKCANGEWEQLAWCYYDHEPAAWASSRIRGVANGFGMAGLISDSSDCRSMLPRCDAVCVVILDGSADRAKRVDRLAERRGADSTKMMMGTQRTGAVMTEL